MTTHRQREKTAAPSYPDEKTVGPHLVIDRVEWVPGEHPDPHRRDDGRLSYPEPYLRCLRCGVECFSEADFPEECEPGD